MKIADITLYPWQETQWQSLTRQIDQQQLAHALLLTGERGLAKLSFAYCAAKFILCQQPNNTPCDHCKSCLLFAAETHPDFFALHPDEGSQYIKVDQVRALVGHFQKSATLNRYQVAVIEPAEKMNIAAANALLKTLEEPSGHVVLILVTHQASQCLATIRSRCQRLLFTLPDETLALNWLQAHPSCASLDTAQLLRLSGGLPMKALALANNEQQTQRQAMLTDLLQVILQQKDPVQVAAHYHKMDLLVFTQNGLLLINDAIRMHCEVDQIINQDFTSQLQTLRMTLSRSALLLIQQYFMKTLRALNTSTNPNRQLLLEALLIDCAMVNQHSLLEQQA